MPTWRVGLWPEELDAQNDQDESSGIIRVDIADWNQSMDKLLNWACSRKPVDTRGAVFGEYELQKFAPGEEKKQKATEAKAISESSVICDVLETRTTEYHRYSVPVMNSIEVFNKNGMALSVDDLVSKKMFTIQNKFMLATL